MFVFRRERANPVLTPRREHPWEALATFNPSVVREKDGWRMYYRALSNPAALVSPYAGQSSVGMAFSEDGVHFHSQQQVLMAGDPWDAYGCEDPRATIFEGKTYLSYTALGGYPFSKDNIKVGMAVSEDGVNFTERHLVTPFNAKAFTLFPERAGGKVAALLSVHTDEPPTEICLALADRIEDFWSQDYWVRWHADWQSHRLSMRRRDEDHVETGSAPVLTERGWVTFYSYIEHYFGGGDRVFTVEAALLDRDDPSRIIDRTEALLVPEEIYERYGIVPEIVFPTSATMGDDDHIELWYGGADTVCAKATGRLPDLLRALDPTKRARTFKRAKENPILTPRKKGFDNRAVFNTAAFELDDTIYLPYRAMDEANTSTVGLAISKDGVRIDERLPEPIYVPRADFEQKKSNPTGNSGCEDPRTVVIDDRLYMTYTAYDGVNPPRGAITSISLDDFRARKFDAWCMPELVTPDQVDDKDVALLPGKVDGNYVLYHRVSNQICADLVPDLEFKKRVSRCIEVMGPRLGMWDGEKVGIAGPPLKIPEGWLMIYHGVSSHKTYRLGFALLDPSGLEVLARTADAVFEPGEAYEKEGLVPNVVFACGAVLRDNTLFLYYGGADQVTGVATASIKHIREALT